MRTTFDQKAVDRECRRALSARLSLLENLVEEGRHEVHLGKRFGSQEDSGMGRSQEESELGGTAARNGRVSQQQLNYPSHFVIRIRLFLFFNN